MFVFFSGKSYSLDFLEISCSFLPEASCAKKLAHCDKSCLASLNGGSTKLGIVAEDKSSVQ